MTKSAFALTASAFILAAAPALANVTVVNQTDETHTVTFDLGADEIKHEVAAGAEVSEACPEGCGVRFSGHDTMATDGDKLAITPDATAPVKTN
jgi:hypothetical protein